MKVIYLTGAPAAGKSSTLALLQEADPSIYRFEYGAELTKFIQEKDASLRDQEELRSLSAKIVTPEDVEALDEVLLGLIEELRNKQAIIVDSHPVTKEQYGYRITAFSQEKVQMLNPDEIWVFYTAPSVALDRIRKRPAGRPNISDEEARMHTALQASVAATYGIATGKPVYLFDTNCDQSELVRNLLDRLRK
jgi:adenylate kinase